MGSKYMSPVGPKTCLGSGQIPYIYMVSRWAGYQIYGIWSGWRHVFGLVGDMYLAQLEMLSSPDGDMYLDPMSYPTVQVLYNLT